MNQYRNFGLLSFGEEAEEDEAETHNFVQKNASKSKSMHDVVDDPKLSKQTAAIEKQADDTDKVEKSPQAESEDEEEVNARRERIRSKLHKKSSSKSDTKRADEQKSSKSEQANDGSSDDDFLDHLDKEKRMKRQQKA